mmetsp:Transcript_7178/g.11912  ORF Transcript_7178/g.11912 Transcript_7178/m.11912 type:complete len:328 (+) Transcript_7178:857-1840(+)
MKTGRSAGNAIKAGNAVPIIALMRTMISAPKWLFRLVKFAELDFPTCQKMAPIKTAMKPVSIKRAPKMCLSRFKDSKSRLRSRPSCVKLPTCFSPACPAKATLLASSAGYGFFSKNPCDSNSSSETDCATIMIQSAGLYFGGNGCSRAPKYSSTTATAPWYMIRPLFIRMRWSNDSKISEEGWWMVNRTLAPALATFFRTLQSCKAENESRPEVGSSRNTFLKMSSVRKIAYVHQLVCFISNPSLLTMLGFVTNSTPTLVRLRSPPEMPLSRAPPTKVSEHPESPSSDSMLSVKESSSSSVVSLASRNLAEKRMHSRGVEEIMSESS